MQLSPLALTSAMNIASATSNTTPTGATSTGVDNNQFMLMLMAQLKNQNPLDPTSDKDMLSQMTQLNSLQELQNLSLVMSQVSQANQASYAASLIGKTVKVALDNGETKEGLVNGTSVTNGQMELQIGEEAFPLGSVIEIKGN